MSDPVSPSNCPKCGALVPPDAPQGYCLHCLLALGAASSRSPEGEGWGEGEPTTAHSAHFAGRSFGDYELLEELGRGGMGIVFKARQKSLDRFVAVKTLRLGEHADKDVALRLRAEAAAAASLHHPHIVAIHEVGAYEGQPYFVMQFIEGQNLARVSAACEVRDGAWIRRSARWVRTIAAAIHHAHEHGILHRDLKPSNILIDPLDEPRITDFGLAKRLLHDSELTLSGQVIGSPNYMPPEQAAARRGQVGRRSDVYSLGAILYHLLTGRPPCVGLTLAETLQEVLTREPIAPRLLNPAVPRDLETLCLKCLEKEPDRRYPTAQALAEDLDRYLRDEPIHARPVNRAEKAWRWCRRKPALAASFAGLLFAIVSGVSGISWQWRRAEGESERAQSEAHAARRNLYAADMNLASQALDAGNVARAIELLEKYQPTPVRTPSTASLTSSNKVGRGETRPYQPSTDLRGWEWRYLWSQTRSDELFTLGRHNIEPGGLAYDPRSGTLASADMLGVIMFWDLASKRLIEEVTFPDILTRLAMSPDGRWLASGGLDGFIRLWDVASRKPMTTISNRQIVGQLAFSPDGKLLAAREATRLSLWEVGSWKPVAEWDEIGTPVESDPEGMAFTPDGNSLAYSRRDGTIVFWSLKTHSEIATLPGNNAYVSNIAISPDGRVLVAGDLRDVIHVWNVPERRKLTQLGRFRESISGAYEVKFSPDGKTFAFLLAQNFILYDTSTWRELITFRGHRNAIGNVLFTGDSRRLVTSAKDGAIKVWDAGQRRPVRFLPATSTNGFDLSEDGGILERQRLTNPVPVRVFSLLDPPALTTRRMAGTFPPQLSLSFPRAGGPIALLFDDGLIQVIHPTNNRVLSQFSSPGRRRIHLSPDGRTLIAGPKERHLPLEVWDVARSNLLGKLQVGRGEIRTTDFTADSSRFIVCFDYGENSGLAEVWDVAGLRKVAVFGTSSSPLGQLRFTRDGKLAIGARMDGTATIWDAATGRELATVAGELDPYFCLALSPDETRLALGGGTGIIGLWDLTTMPPQYLATLPANDGLLYQVAFTPDGHTLVARSDNGVRIWHAPPLSETDAPAPTK